MDDRIHQILGRFKNKQSIDVDHNYKLNFEVTSRVIKNNADKILAVLNSEEIFDEERLVSDKYRVLGNINIITDNTISDPSGKYPTPWDWDPLFDGTPPISPNNWLLQITYPYKMDDEQLIAGTKSYYGIRVNNVVPTNPSGSRQQVGVNCVQNHNLNVGDYVYLYDTTTNTTYQGLHKIESLGVNGVNETNSFTLETEFNGSYGNMNLKRVVDPSPNDIRSGNKLQGFKLTTTDKSGTTTNTDYTTITSTQPHQLRVADSVEILMGTSGNYMMNGVYKVEHVVDDYNFVVKVRFSNVIGFSLTSNFIYRRMDGVPSEYYTRKFKVLTTNTYDVHRGGFGNTIYPDTRINELGITNETWLFQFTRDINVGSLMDHRGGAISELYFTVLKRSGENTFNWSDVTSHWEFDKVLADYNNKLETVSRNVPGGVGTIEKKYMSSEYFGDFVEYNRKEIREKIITPVVHRFTINTNPSKDGYYYKPFTKVDIRNYSNLIEVAEPKDNVEGIPGNNELRPNGNVEWRDLLTPGFLEEGNGVDYPFLNGAHYIFIKHNIYVRRQVPPSVLTFNTSKTITPTNIC